MELLVTLRPYQEAIVATCLMKNTLVVLPTGLGKTKTAIAALLGRLRQYPEGKVLFLTPTRPLAAQIRQEFLSSTSLDPSLVSLFTGTVSPEKRAELFLSSRVIVSTPQTIAHDVVSGRCDLTSVVGLVFDEVHRCVKDYDYTWLAQQYHKVSPTARIIGLTASPGSDLTTISAVCKNAFIEAVEVRTEQDSDVSPYVQESTAEWITVELPAEFLLLRTLLSDCLSRRFVSLKDLGFSVSSRMSKTELLDFMKLLQGKIASGHRDLAVLRGVSVTAEVLKISHALEMLETQGVAALCSYMEGLFSARATSKAVKNLVADVQFHQVFLKGRELLREGIEHPKLTRLKDILAHEFSLHPSLKVIVFNQYRDNAQLVVASLRTLSGLRPQLFVGQAKKHDTGMSQKEQLATLAAFSAGTLNVLVSTSIGEEGLDIPQVDLIVFYEPVPSAIRSIQRRGRTARLASGRVLVLMAKNTRDEISHWVSFHKEKRMHTLLKDLQQQLTLESQPTLASFSAPAASLRIVADSRESGGPVLKKLADVGFTVALEQLPVADFVLGDGRIGVERKTVADFVASLLDHRLLSQVKALRESFEKPLLLIEGREDLYTVRQVHANALRGALATIALSFSVPIIFTRDAEDTAAFLLVVAKREGDVAKKDIGVRLERKPLSTREMQLYILESLPLVGPHLAQALLAHFGSVYAVFTASVVDLEQVPGVGPKIAQEIYTLIRQSSS